MLSFSCRFVVLDRDDIAIIHKANNGAPSVTKRISLLVFLLGTVIMLSVTAVPMMRSVTARDRLMHFLSFLSLETLFVCSLC